MDTDVTDEGQRTESPNRREFDGEPRRRWALL
jgi:hypothetical protein